VIGAYLVHVCTPIRKHIC